jgi:DNA-binding PadR family transcriptional regulator
LNSQDVILGLLLDGPKTGYEIKHLFESPLSFFFDASFGTIYPTLGKLEKAGYIVKESVVQDNRPNKNVYSITEAGRERFRQYLDSPPEKEAYKSDFMVRLFFGEHQERDTVVAWIRQAIEQTKTELRQLQEGKAVWKPEMSPSQLICLNLGLELNEVKIRVLEEGLAQLLSADQASD